VTASEADQVDGFIAAIYKSPRIGRCGLESALDGAAIVSAEPIKAVKANISFRSPKDLPLLYAHQAVVNFTGHEFYVTVYATAPEPWVTTLDPNVEAVPLARFAFSPVFWMALVQSVSDQLQSMEEQGAISAEMRAAAKAMVVKL
jgi:hypothetical protein